MGKPWYSVCAAFVVTELSCLSLQPRADKTSPFERFLFFSWRHNWSRSQGPESLVIWSITHPLLYQTGNDKSLPELSHRPVFALNNGEQSPYGFFIVSVETAFFDGVLELLHCPLYLFFVIILLVKPQPTLFNSVHKFRTEGSRMFTTQMSCPIWFWVGGSYLQVLTS